MEPLVSIVMPTYNCAKYIEESVVSVIKQTYTNWELIIIDDCSTDNTEDIVKRYCEKDNRIKYFRLDVNSGAAIARNEGIKCAKGRYIAFLDSDDLWMEKSLRNKFLLWKKINIILHVQITCR